MYGKIFDSIFDSTLSADGGWLPTYIFMSMIVLADKDGLVDIAPKALYRRLGFRDYDSKISADEFESAIKYLEQIDTESRSSLEQGRRIIKTSRLDDIETNRGWVIVNYDHYRNKGSREDRAKQSTERSRRWRQKKLNKNNNETQGDAKGRKGRYTDTDTDTDKEKTTTARSVPDEALAALKKVYPKRSGGQPWSRASKALNARLKAGEDLQAVIDGAERYGAYCVATDRINTEYVMQAATFVGPDRHYLEPWNPPKSKSERKQDKNIDAALQFLENSNAQH